MAGDGAMSYRLTLVEAESYLRKAARASGLDWGIAEEAGKTARWLAAFDLPGPETTLAHLRNLSGKDYTAFVPDCNLDPWQASGDQLCPIITGAALADRATLMLEGDPIKLDRTAYPLLLAGALGQAARYYQTAFTLCWAGVRMTCFAHGVSINGNRDSLLMPEVPHVCCCQEDLSNPEQQASTRAYSIDDDVFRQIDALAFKIYLPATEESRAGAGAGLTDND
jgi:hypothetical protein